jgi:hypothetical protein
MSKFIWLPGALVLAMSIPFSAWAASDADLAEIREQIRQLKENYEARIQALEQKLKQAEAATPGPAAAAPPQPVTVLAAPAAAVPSPGLSAFNPAISAVLQGTYANLSQDPSRYAITGFALGSDVSPGKRGFSLGESELAISANVDDKFAGNLIVSLTPENTVSVEEAYGIVTALPDGLTPKFGRFFSGLGYLNEQHQHVWDFVDAPLAYQAFLGGQYTNEVDRAHRRIPRVRSGSREWRQLSRRRSQQERGRQRYRLRAHRRRHRRKPQLAGGTVVSADPRAGPPVRADRPCRP